jgi:hypothetical protein
MNRGTKVFLGLAGVAVTLGGVILLTSKPAHAAEPKPETEPEDGDVVVVPPQGDDSPPVVVSPAVDIPETNRLLLRWWSAEGAAFPMSEHPPGTPQDFGSSSSDLGDTFGPRNLATALAFCQGNCTTAVLNALKAAGTATPGLFAALQKWAATQQLDEAQQASSPTEPAPIVIQPPGSDPVVVVPPNAPGPVAPQNGPQDAPAPGPPPFLPPLPTPTPAPQPAPAPVQVAPSAPAAPVNLPDPIPPAPVVTAPPVASAPSLVRADTAALVQALLADEATNGWKKKSPAVQAWQKSRGLKQDGQFGPKSALVVAAEVGTVPIVRYWPAGAQQAKAVRDYQATLLELANAAPEPRASQLRVSAQREQGQGFGSKQTALAPSQRVQLSQVA